MNHGYFFWEEKTINFFASFFTKMYLLYIRTVLQILHHKKPSLGKTTLWRFCDYFFKGKDVTVNVRYCSSVFFMFLEFASGPCCGRRIWCYSPSKKFCQSPVESRNDKICHKNSDPTDLTPTPSQQSWSATWWPQVKFWQCSLQSLTAFIYSF